MASFNLKPIGTWVALLLRGRDLFESPYAEEQARSAVERARRAKRDKEPASRFCVSVSGVLVLVILSIALQFTDVLFARYIPIVVGVYPKLAANMSSQSSLDATVPDIGIRISYAELANYCSGGGKILTCIPAGPWWDKSYALMLKQALPIASPPSSIAASTLQMNLSWTPSGLDIVQTVNEDGTIAQVTALYITAGIPTILNGSSSFSVVRDQNLQGLVGGLTVAVPLAGVSNRLAVTPTRIFEQTIWNATIGSSGNSTNITMVAEAAMEFNLGFSFANVAKDDGSQTVSVGAFGAQAVQTASWISLLLQPLNSIGQQTLNLTTSSSTFVSSGPQLSLATLLNVTSINVTAYTGAVCATANLLDGSTYEMIFVSSYTAQASGAASFVGVRGMVWRNTFLTAAAYQTPLFVVSQSIAFADVLPCRIFDPTLPSNASTNSAILFVARCSAPGVCRQPSLLNVPLDPQPTIMHDLKITLYNPRNRTLMASRTSFSTNQISASLSSLSTSSSSSSSTNTALSGRSKHLTWFYTAYSATTGARIPASQLWIYEPDQTLPGVCTTTASSQCYGSQLPVWLIIVVVVILILTELSTHFIEDVMDIVIYGFLSTTGPYYVALGPAVFSYDALYLAKLTSCSGYVGVQPVGQHSEGFHIASNAELMHRPNGSLGDLSSSQRSLNISDHIHNPDSRRPVPIKRAHEAIALSQKDKTEL